MSRVGGLDPGSTLVLFPAMELILILRIQKTPANLHDMTLFLCTPHPADKLKTINAAPVIKVHSALPRIGHGFRRVRTFT